VTTLTTTAPVASVPTPFAGITSLTLQDMLEDGIYLLFLLKCGNPPNTYTEFNMRVEQFLLQFEKNARNLGKPAKAIEQAKYAFCALLDEVILSSDFDIRNDWERAPLQLRMFGEHLAGERFFDRLEALRAAPEENIETLEVFHCCLLLGFQGKYLLEGNEKLDYLVASIEREITRIRGGKAEFAPNWKLPQRFQQYVRHELPLWLFFALLATVAAGFFLFYSWQLSSASDKLKHVDTLLPAKLSTT
jgi:type VI secretion system protein ImpK